MSRAKATLIYRKPKNLHALQLLLGHTRLESTVRYFGIAVDDALEIAPLDITYLYTFQKCRRIGCAAQEQQ